MPSVPLSFRSHFKNNFFSLKHEKNKQTMVLRKFGFDTYLSKKKKAFEFLFIKYRYKKRDKHNIKKGLVKEI